jgi:tetratricopeptide (TPR) repeat protein
MSTFKRNQVWSSSDRLWTDTAGKAPSKSRPFAYIGKIHGLEKPIADSNYDASMKAFSRAAENYPPRTGYRSTILSNRAAVHYRYGYYEQAADDFRIVAESSETKNDHVLYYLGQSLVFQGKFEESIDVLSKLLQSEPDRFYLLSAANLRGIAALQSKKPELAIESFSIGVRNSPRKGVFYHGLGAVLARQGKYADSEVFLQKALESLPREPRVLLNLIENSYRLENNQDVQKYLGLVTARFSIGRIFDELQCDETSFAKIPLNCELTERLVKDYLVSLPSYSTTLIERPERN